MVYAAVGYALTRWEWLEIELCGLFCVFTDKPRASQTAIEAYSSGATFITRADRLRESSRDYAIFRHDQTKEGQFLSLLCKARTMSERRNDIAHGMVAYYYGPTGHPMLTGYVVGLPEGGDLTFCLTSPLYDKRRIAFGLSGQLLDFQPEYVYVAEQIRAYGDDFTALTHEIISYEVSLEPRNAP